MTVRPSVPSFCRFRFVVSFLHSRLMCCISDGTSIHGSLPAFPCCIPLLHLPPASPSCIPPASSPRFPGTNDAEINIGASLLSGRNGADLTNLSVLSQTLVNSIDQLDEFSYFKSDKLKLWLGPDHWKPTSLVNLRPKTAQVSRRE